MLKILYADCLGLSPAISSQFTVEMCTANKNCEKITETPLLGVQGRSRSSMLTNLKSPCLLWRAASRYVPICNRFHTIKVNSGKITFLEEVPLVDAFIRGEFPQPLARNFVTIN